MKEIMPWEKCKSEFLREVEIDHDKIKSIKETAEKRLKFIKQNKVTTDNVSFVVEGYYEVIKELLIALLLSKGLRSSNHQCLISYFYHHFHQFEAEVHVLEQMCYVRNRLTYYGEEIPYRFYQQYYLEFEHIIGIIKQLIK